MNRTFTPARRIVDARCEIRTDGETIWINDVTGCCIGRFSRSGVDVHHAGMDQLKDGKQCLDCFHEGAPAELWTRFVGSMLAHHGVAVPIDFRPGWSELLEATTS